MHKKLADKGLAVISVSVDDAKDKGMVEAANAFLRKQQPAFANLLLDEPHEFWSKKLNFTIPPCYFVFDRRGRWLRFNPSDFDTEEQFHKEMDGTILRMLNEK